MLWVDADPWVDAEHWWAVTPVATPRHRTYYVPAESRTLEAIA